jgi:hypothetical protein
VHRRRAIEGLDRLLTGLVVELSPPLFDLLDHAVAVRRNLLSGCAGSVSRRDVGELHPIFDAVNGGFEEGLADAKDVVAQESNGAISVVDRALVETFVGNLAGVTLCRAQYNDPLRKQGFWGERGMPGALQTDKLGDVLEVLAENVLAASREYRHGADAELEQLLFARGIVDYVNRDEVNALFRKKLFRPKATASTRLSEQDEFVGDVFHGRIV